MLRRLVLSSCVAVLMALSATAPGLAANQTGLVNVNIEDNTIQLPIALAANVCDVTVAILVADLRDDGEATCEATAVSVATAEPGGGGGGNTNQTGLVNVNVSGNTVQVPLAVALNICDVDLAVLVAQYLDTGTATCTADARSRARG